MIKLHGVLLSNYFSMVKHALLAKGIAFEFVQSRPSQEADFLTMSPMGKVPFIETPQGFLSETDAILDYLEEAYPAVPLLPADAFQRAKVRQIMKVQELYVETPIHNMIGVIFGREVPAHVKEASQPAARKGLAALGRLVQLQPWLAGPSLTMADVFVFYSLVLSNRIAGAAYQWDLLGEVPGLADWFQRFSALDVTQTVLKDNLAALEARIARH